MTLFGAYKRLYLSLVDWGRNAHGPQDLPEYKALLALSIVATMNLFTMIMFAELALGRRNVVPNPKLSALLSWAGFVVLHYVTLLPAARRSRVAGAGSVPGGTMWWVCLYGIASFVAYMGVLTVRMDSE